MKENEKSLKIMAKRITCKKNTQKICLILNSSKFGLSIMYLGWAMNYFETEKQMSWQLILAKN